MDGINELIEDHARLKDLFTAVEMAPTKEIQEDYYVELRVQFEVHGSVELESLWPLVSKYFESATVGEDWDELRILFGQLDEFEIGTEKWGKAFQQLKRRSLVHFEIEERDIFTPIAEKLTPAEHESVARRIIETKQKYSA